MKISQSVLSSLPQKGTIGRMFGVGATVGPLVDSLHNQCLLEYDIAPISISISLSSGPGSGSDLDSYVFCSSWLIPPLLGFAYVVLGCVLPSVFRGVLVESTTTPTKLEGKKEPTTASLPTLRTRAIQAVLSTAVIIRLSEYLQTTTTSTSLLGYPPHYSDPFPFDPHTVALGIMAVASLLQWAVLDATPVSLAAALLVSVGGPLAELPFVGVGCWHYLPSASDYHPLAFLSSHVGTGTTTGGFGFPAFLREIPDLALSSITGPCYFAVTMDAIALGRYFDAVEMEAKPE